MAVLAEETILQALRLLEKFDEKSVAELREKEDKLDWYEDKLGTALVRLSSKALSDADSRNVSKQLHTIGDFERIGDHALNLMGVAEEIHEKKITFSDAARKELSVLLGALRDILSLTTKAFVEDDLSLAVRVEPLEQVIDNLTDEIKANHIARLQKGHCTIEMGFVLSDLLTNCERVSDHCSNVAIAQIETAQNMYKAHEYINNLKLNGNEEYREAYEAYAAKYVL